MAQKVPKSGKIINFNFPFFPQRLGHNTSKTSLNVIKYHSGVGKKESLNFEKF